MTKAFGYLRCSSPGSVDGDTWERQMQLISAYCARYGVEIVEWFRDEGVPGKTELENRPGLSACLARVESNGVRMVIVERADRLARDTVISELVIQEFQKASCTVISADGAVNLTEGNDLNPTAKLVRQILAVVAEFERCMTVLRTRGARERIRRDKGRCEGVKPFGTKPGEKLALEFIIAFAYRGEDSKEIAHELNAAGIPTRYGKRWHSGTVAKIIARQTTGV